MWESSENVSLARIENSGMAIQAARVHLDEDVHRQAHRIVLSLVCALFCSDFQVRGLMEVDRGTNLPKLMFREMIA